MLGDAGSAQLAATGGIGSWLANNVQYWDPFTAAFWTPVGPVPTPSMPAPAAAPAQPSTSLWDSIAPTPGSSIADLLYNASTGNVSQDQVNQLTQQAAAEYTQAGMDPSDALNQASEDINAALVNSTLPGAFGITWTGAQPGGTNWLTQAAANISGVNSGGWIWWALGGIGALYVLSRR